MSGNKSRLRVCHVITDLAVGGAQMMLVKLLSQLDRSQFDNRVIALTQRGPMAGPIEELGVPVEVCRMHPRLPSPAACLRLCRHLRQARPDVVQTWLYHSDLLGALAAKFVRRRVPVVWNIRINSLRSDINKRSTFWTVQLCSRLSRFLPAQIVVNTDAGKRLHEQIGYAAEKFVVIPNGFDTRRFRPSDAARRLIRAELDISESTPLVGLVGRYHPQKDHGTFLNAAGNILKCRPGSHFLLCGEDVDRENQELLEKIQKIGSFSNFHLLGRREDLPMIQASLDVAVLSSVTEGFPNVIGEAMSCGVPCVVTDAGGSSEVVGDTGRVVPCGNPTALADACLEILNMSHEERHRLGALARQRVVEQFSLERVTELYAELWQRVAGAARVNSPRDARRAA